MAPNSHTPPVISANIRFFLEKQQSILAQIDAHIPFDKVLAQFALSIEARATIKTYVSVLLYETDGEKLQHCVAPTLSKPFCEVIENIEIDLAKKGFGPFTDEPVYVTDIATDARWIEYRELALSSGLRACWTIPVKSISGKLLGIMACCFTEPVAPASGDIEVLECISHIVALANERYASRWATSAAEARYRQIFNSATDFAIISTDLHGRVTEWNEGAHRILGWSEEEMLGRSLHQIFMPNDVADGWPEKEMECALLQSYSPDERWHLRKSGERFWAVGQLTPLKNNAGDVLGFVKIMRDRTRHRELDAQLQELTATLETQVAQRTRERDRIWRNSMDLLLIIGPDGVLRSINPAWTTILDYEPEDLVGKYFEPFVHPDDVQSTIAAISQASQGPLEDFEVRIRHKNGPYRWFAWRAAPEEDMVYANGRDITVEKWQAEQITLTNEARLQLALEAGAMGAWEWNAQSDRVYWLQGAAAVHGVPDDDAAPEMTMNEYAERYIHPDDVDSVMAVIGRAIVEGERHRVEYRIMWPDGSVHWLEGRGEMFMDESGKPSQMVGVAVDITRRKRAEQDLKFLAQASAELAGLVDPQSTLDRLSYLAVPDFADWCAIDLLQEDGTLKRVAVAHTDPQKVQLAYEMQRRFPPDPAQPQGAWNVIRTGQAQLISELTDEVLEKSIADPGYLAALRELGLRSYMGVPLSAHGKILGVVSFVAAESGRLYSPDDLILAEDLARRAAVALENAELYRVVRQSDQAKDVFLAILAHELRNPLAAIVGGLSMLTLAIDDKKRIEHYAKLIQRQTNQLTRLVDDLMDVSRISTGKIELKKEKTSLAGIINSAIESSRPELEARQHKLSVSLPGEQTDIHADPVRLTQVFSNLLTNAAKYTDPGGNIDVVLEGTSEEFTVRVRDTGIGISQDQLKNIFKIFTQIEHPLKRSQGGLGIGLSLVDGLVGLHEGRVEAFSPGEGQGSEFVVHLPRAAEYQAANDVVQSTRHSIAQQKEHVRRILVVDDNIDAATSLTDILNVLGHEVRTVHDGLSAVTAAEEMNPDIVLLDIGLPGIDGYEVARRIRMREGSRHLAVLIALTGWGQERDKRRAYDAGFDHHCVKPIGLEQLKQFLQS
jgi:PAS domain S-box-containing protein